jgi:hypothetical protein
MKLNMLFELKDLNGKPILDADQKPQILRKFLVEVLGVLFENERNLDGNERYKRGKLAFQLQTEDKPEISIEDVALLKQLIGRGYPPHIVYVLWNILENKD